MTDIKLVAIGDGAVGKTSLLVTFSKGTYPEEHVPTVFQNYTKSFSVDNTEYSLRLMDTAGQEDYDRLRPLSYPNADVVLCCFSIDTKASADNIDEKWAPEVRHFLPSVPLILVGTKSDLRTDAKTLARLRKTRSSLVTTEEATALQQKIGAEAFIECSAKSEHNLKEVFETAVQVVVAGRRSCCTLL